nr:hypothetical protein [Angustibacter aerolatus]
MQVTGAGLILMNDLGPLGTVAASNGVAVTAEQPAVLAGRGSVRRRLGARPAGPAPRPGAHRSVSVPDVHRRRAARRHLRRVRLPAAGRGPAGRGARPLPRPRRPPVARRPRRGAGLGRGRHDRHAARHAARHRAGRRACCRCPSSRTATRCTRPPAP